MIEQVDRVLLPGQRVALLHCAIPLIQRTYESAVYGFETAKGRSWIGELGGRLSSYSNLLITRIGGTG